MISNLRVVLVLLCSVLFALSARIPSVGQAENGQQINAFLKDRGDAFNTGRATGKPIKDPHEWNFAVHYGACSTPAYDGEDTLYFGQGGLHAVNASTGIQKWEFMPNSVFNATPIIGRHNLLYVCDASENAYAINYRTGKQVWCVRLPHPVEPTITHAANGSVAIDDEGTVYAGCGRGPLVALDGKTGKQKWVSKAICYELARPAFSNEGYLLIGNQRIAGQPLTGGLKGDLYALDRRDGSIRWQYAMEEEISGCVAVGQDNTVYVGSGTRNSGKMVALNGTTGQLKWERKFSGFVSSSPALSPAGLLYFGCADKKVYALDCRDGSTSWQFETGGSIWASPAIGEDGTIYIGSGDHKLYALNGKTGELKWTFETGEGIYTSPIISPDGTLFFGSYDRSYYALPRATQDRLAREKQ